MNPYLSGFRGAPLILVFHGEGWDPARHELIELYERVLADSGHSASSIPLHIEDRAEVAALFGVEGSSAVFVIDADGVIRWSSATHGGGLPSAASIERALALSGDPRATDDAHGVTRRQFVATIAGTAIAIALSRRLEAQPRTKRVDARDDGNSVTLNVNGRDVSLAIDPRVTLLDALREYAGITGTKKGCDHGQCGACTVHIDGRRALSCLTFAMMATGKKITTIEGLAATSGATGDQLHPLQDAFIKHDGFQCGYCTSGQLMSASAVVHEPWGPSDGDVREAMSGNICRCGAYPGIVAAIQEVRGGQHR